MTVTEQLTAAKQYGEIWKALMPDIHQPETDQLLLWAGRYAEDLVLRGINRAARKARKLRDTEPMDTVSAVKYASSVMKNESIGARVHANGYNAPKSRTAGECAERTAQ